MFSFEFFPPKTDAGQQALERTIRELADLAPAFVSVTYGAGGSTRSKTLELVRWIEREARLTAMAHLTCVGATETEIGGVVDRLVDAGIDNIMALRGDPPAGQERFERTTGGFGYAADLIGFIRKRYGQRLCLGGAGSPEGHIECRDLDRDIMHLKAKVDAGQDQDRTHESVEHRRLSLPRRIDGCPGFLEGSESKSAAAPPKHDRRTTGAYARPERPLLRASARSSSFSSRSIWSSVLGVRVSRPSCGWMR